MADINETPVPSERGAPIRAHIANVGDMAAMFSDLNRLRDIDSMRVWHPFPTTSEELQSALTEISAEESRHTAFVIIDYKTDIPGLYDRLPYDANVDELNFLAAKLADMTEPEREVFGAVMLSGRHSDSVMEIINATENMDLFDLQPAYCAEQYGEFLADMEFDEYAVTIEKLEKSHDPDMRELAGYITRLERYFDSTTYARDRVKAENGVFTEYGLLTESRGFEAVYTDVPPEYRLSAPPEPEPMEKPSVMDKLAAAKDAAAKACADKPAAPPKSHDAEL